MLDRISPHHRTLYMVLDEEFEHAPASAEMNGKCDWCGGVISMAGWLDDHTAYSCVSCNQRRYKYILSSLLDWDIAIASRYSTPSRSFRCILKDLKAGWGAEIQKIIKESGALK